MARKYSPLLGGTHEHVQHVGGGLCHVIEFHRAAGLSASIVDFRHMALIPGVRARSGMYMCISQPTFYGDDRRGGERVLTPCGIVYIMVNLGGGGNTVVTSRRSNLSIP